MIVLLIGIFIVAYVLSDAILWRLLRAANHGPAFLFAVGVTLISWYVLGRLG